MIPRTRLLPVVEFDPFEFRRDRRPPDRSIAEEPRAWAEFWRDSLADRGVRGLTPLPETWVVPVDQLADRQILETLLAVHTGEPTLLALLESLPGPFDGRSGMNGEGESIEEFLEVLRGGLALVPGDPGEPAIVPECCGDLGNWRDWLNATRVETQSWQDLWIGHPSARVARIADRLLVQKVLESGEPAGAPVELDPSGLIAAVDEAKAELRELVARLHLVVAGCGVPPELARRIATRLGGLSRFELD